MNKHFRFYFPIAIATILTPLFASTAAGQETRLLRMPDISSDHIAFVYANDIWIADRDGSGVRRLTTFEGAETNPHFSPDGRWVAFSGQYDGNTDVYVVSVDGGEPNRLTWHPYSDIVKGWTVDGTRILFASGRDVVPVPIPRFWTIALEGANPEPLPLPRANNGHYSPDGSHLVYEMVTPWESEFRSIG
jgi:tricorn protease